MTIESPFANVNDLNTSYPEASTVRAHGDDHLRGIKTTLKSLLAAVPGVMDGTPAELTISSGAITPTVSFQHVDTESDTASDDLDTITATNFYTGGFLWLRAENTARTVVVKHGTGNIVLDGSNDFSLDSLLRHILLWYDGSNWQEIFRTRGDGTYQSADGVVATPAHSFAADPDTGGWRVGSNIYGISAGGNLVAAFVNAKGIDVSGTQSADEAYGISSNQDADGTKEYFAEKCIEIGTWDMTTTANATVAHSLADITKIRSITVWIRSDDDANGYPLGMMSSGIVASNWSVNTTNVLLHSSTTLANSFFNASSFDTMGDDGNRGWIFIKYAAK